MEIYRVSFIGHRKIFELRRVFDQLDDVLQELLRTHEYVEFYMGRNGDFDVAAASAVKHAQKRFGDHNSTLILALPYHVKDEEYYEQYYQEIILPISEKTYPKNAIAVRNQWLVDNSDLLISYVDRPLGGAYTTVEYAKHQNKRILPLGSIT